MKLFKKIRLWIASILMGLSNNVSKALINVEIILELRKVVENPALNFTVKILTQLTTNIPDEQIWKYFKIAVIQLAEKHEFLIQVRECIQKNPDNLQSQVNCLVSVLRKSDIDLRNFIYRDLARIMTIIMGKNGEFKKDLKEGKLNEAIEIALELLKLEKGSDSK